MTAPKLADGAALGNLEANSIGIDKLDTAGVAQEGYVLVYRTAEGKRVYEDIAAVVGADTYQVKLGDSGDPPEFVLAYLKKFCNI